MAKSRAQSGSVTPEKTLYTLADTSHGRNPARLTRGRSYITDDNDDGNDEDYIEDEVTLDCDDEALAPDLSNDACGSRESSHTQDTSEHQTTAVESIGTRSQSQAATRHEEATRAKLLFLERLSHGAAKTAEEVGRAGDAGPGGAGKEGDEKP
jgi:hypothetical protein